MTPMRPTLLLLLLVPILGAQGTDDPVRLKARVKELENEVLRLQAEVDRLRTELDRLRTAPSNVMGVVGGQSGEAASSRPRVADRGYAAFTAMPYGEDTVYLVTRANSGGSQTSTGKVRHRIELELTALPPEATRSARRYQMRGTLYFAFPGGLPPRATRHRVVIESLDRIQARRWFDSLQPGEIGEGAQQMSVYKQLAFALVPTSQTHFDGYEGNSGTVTVHRGRLHWEENNVFFLENGNLVVIGDGAARWHLRFLRDESATPIALR